MKNGKYVNLGIYSNIKIGYGTVDNKNLKSIYIKLNTWVSPKSVDNFEKNILKIKKKIKDKIYYTENEYFKKECIVDFDLKTKGIKENKRSFMNLEITLFNSQDFDLKNKTTKKYLNDFIKNNIIENLINEDLFTFNLTK